MELTAPPSEPGATGASRPDRLQLAAAAMAAAGAVVCLDIWRDIFTIALKDEEAQQVLLAIPVFAWLAWTRRDHLAAETLRPSLLGPALIAAGWAASWIGFHHAVQALWHGSAVLVLVGCLVSVLGPGLIRALWPAFVVLIFLVPVPGSLRLAIAVPLQGVAATWARIAGDLLGMDIQQDGNLLTYNGVPVEIAEGCNGMRMIFMLVLVSFAFAFVTPLKDWARVLVIALSPLTAMASNIIRLVPTVYMFGHAEHATAEQFHDLAGWAMVFVALALLAGLVHLLDWAGIPVMADRPPGEPRA